MSGYAPHAGYVAPARRSSALFHTLIGFLAVEFFYRIGRDALDFFAFNLAPDRVGQLLAPDTAAGALYDLFAFGVLGLAVIFVVWMTHHRGPRSLLGDAQVWKHDMLRATVGGALLYLVLEIVVPWWTPSEATLNPLGPWLLYLPWALVALLIQTGAEEIFYRGYLQQQIAARFSSPLIWLTVPNIAFASVHWYNGDGYADSVQYVIWAFLFGLAASDLTARTGSLGAAIGFHMANNIFAFLVVEEVGAPDSGLALFLVSPLPDTGELVLPDPSPVVTLGFGIDLAILALAWLAVRVAVRR